MTAVSTSHAPANAIRFLSIDAIERVGEGHPGTPLGSAETAAALFTRHLKFSPLGPLWFDRDRVVVSNGHGSRLLYSPLYLTGCEKITADEIKRFRELGSRCEGHPEFDPSCGIETTTGPLGQPPSNHPRHRFGGLPGPRRAMPCRRPGRRRPSSRCRAGNCSSGRIRHTAGLYGLPGPPASRSRRPSVWGGSAPSGPTEDSSA